MSLKLPYKISDPRRDFKDIQKNFDYLGSKLFLGRQGYGRYVSTVAGNAINTGWSFINGTIIPNDSNFFELGTPPGTPQGVACAANSGVRVKQDGVYKVLASLLCQGATVAGRYDAYLAALNSAGAVGYWMDQWLSNVPTGSAHVKFALMSESWLQAGSWIWPVNITSQTYGDGGGGWSHMEVRYMGK